MENNENKENKENIEHNDQKVNKKKVPLFFALLAIGIYQIVRNYEGYYITSEYSVYLGIIFIIQSLFIILEIRILSLLGVIGFSAMIGYTLYASGDDNPAFIFLLILQGIIFLIWSIIVASSFPKNNFKKIGEFFLKLFRDF